MKKPHFKDKLVDRTTWTDQHKRIKGRKKEGRFHNGKKEVRTTGEFPY